MNLLISAVSLKSWSETSFPFRASSASVSEIACDFPGFNTASPTSWGAPGPLRQLAALETVVTDALLDCLSENGAGWSQCRE